MEEQEPIEIVVTLSDEEVGLFNGISERILDEWKGSREVGIEAARQTIAELAITHTKIVPLDLQKLLDSEEEDFYEALFKIGYLLDIDNMSFTDPDFVPFCAKPASDNGTVIVSANLLFNGGKETLQ